MRFKVKKNLQGGNAGAPVLLILIVACVFIGSFLLVLWIIYNNCSNNFMLENVLTNVLNMIAPLLITGLLGGVGVYILFTLLFVPPVPYKGYIESRGRVAPGLAEICFVTNPNEKTKAAVSPRFSFIAEDDGSLQKGDQCIAYIKEATYSVKWIEKYDGYDSYTGFDNAEMDQNGRRVRTQTRSMADFMGFLFSFIAVVFVLATITTLASMISRMHRISSPFLILFMSAPLVVMVNIIKYILRVKNQFLEDNAIEAERIATGYGFENAALELPQNFRVEGSGYNAVIRADGDIFYTIRTNSSKARDYTIEDASGNSRGSIKYNAAQLGSLYVTFDGLQPFSIRRKLTMDTALTDYAISGIDIYVDGMDNFMKMSDPDGTVFANMTYTGSYGFDVTVLQQFDANVYMGLVAACVLICDARREDQYRRRRMLRR